LSYKRRYVIWA